jgi:hypothetical protein
MQLVELLRARGYIQIEGNNVSYERVDGER